MASTGTSGTATAASGLTVCGLRLGTTASVPYSLWTPNSPTAEAASVAGKGTPASPKKTLPQREAELRTMLATAEGRADLEALAARYAAHGGGVRHGSVVTYILIHERTRGLIG